MRDSLILESSELHLGISGLSAPSEWVFSKLANTIKKQLKPDTYKMLIFFGNKDSVH